MSLYNKIMSDQQDGRRDAAIFMYINAEKVTAICYTSSRPTENKPALNSWL